MKEKRICISVDAEEDLPGFVPRGTRGIDIGLPGLLRLLDEAEVRADFFFLSEIVKAYPDLVRGLADAGHGVGNHGLNHDFLCAKSPQVQKQEILESTRILEDVAPQATRMFRAAGFSADAVTLRTLEGLGYVIDSSILPGRFARRFRILPVYDHRGARREPHFPNPSGARSSGARLLEIPVTENPLRPGAPLGLGALNVYGTEAVVTTLKEMDARTIVFLVHPWELIDIKSYYPRVPEGYARACSPDLTAFREFLSAVRPIATFSTLLAVWRGFRGDSS